MKETEIRDELTLALQQSKDNVKHQARLAGLAILVTIVLCFALTVAWYSNILHTSDLTFNAESWDFLFTGSVNVGNTTLMAAPGDSGIISLSVANNSDKVNTEGKTNSVSTIGMNVNFDKSEMDLLEKRIYFYVDHQKEINGETVEKQYLSTSESYQYIIYPGRTLTISPEYSNDFPIKWEWVYDVVGYYVKGQLEGNEIVDPEYIRPIEFDISQVSYDSQGNIVTVNGVNIEDYLEENYLSKDGYKGNTANKTGKYYKVVDDVYIYLCNKTEITNNTLDDKTFASGADMSDYTAKIILTGVKANEKAHIATTSSDMASSINKGHNIIRLEGDMLLKDNIVVEKGTDVTIDLAGHTLKVDATITANQGSSIGFINGKIHSENSKATFINATSSEVYLDNIILDNFYSGIEVYDVNSTEDSHIHISGGSKLTTEDSVVWLRGNGDKSSRKTTLMVENSFLKSTGYIPVGGNGTYSNYGTDIKIISSTLEGKYLAVFNPMDHSELLIKDSTLTGITALGIKGGHVKVENSTLHGIGTPSQIESEGYSQSGIKDRGSAIYVEDNYVIDNNSHITIEIYDTAITGNMTHLKSDHGKAIEVYKADSEHVSIITYGGIYSTDISDYLPYDGSKKVTNLADGTFKVDNK